ncbi:MAG: D-2-hydroxyacid dehydrogenase [Clostridia bacterium]|nr:D-2-hydroxyacid dehydrogenase [Clostridia bacterium]MDE7215679.1 D-2-hydroxyacid dehydrogenase [Clostridia bacterium]
MKIVILDGYTTDEGTMSWSDLAALGELSYYERTLPEQRLERAREAEILISNKVVLDKELLEKIPNLKYIGLLSTGYNIVDIEYAKKRNIPVCNIPDYSTKSVAQLTVALLLEIAMGVGKHNSSAVGGDWNKCKDFCYRVQDIMELDGKTIGLIGYGAIAKEVAKITRALGMKVLAYKRHNFSGDGIAQSVSLDELLAQSDVISLHCPMNEDSDRLICNNTVNKMKDGVIIVNTARGGVVDEIAVREGLDSGKIGGYGADVLSCEPPKDNPLIGAPRCYITPHIAWASEEARTRLMKIAVENVKSFLNGKAQNCVYPYK